MVDLVQEALAKEVVATFKQVGYSFYNVDITFDNYFIDYECINCNERIILYVIGCYWTSCGFWNDCSSSHCFDDESSSDCWWGRTKYRCCEYL